MDVLTWLAGHAPLVFLFVAVALGYFAGKLKIGNFVLGGIAGTLIVGVILGQAGVTIDSAIKDIFFALFIYAVGYQGGPQFFQALSLKSLNQLLSAGVMCVLGLLTVLAFAWGFGLDRGTAAGLAAEAQPVGDPSSGSNLCYRGQPFGRYHPARKMAGQR